MMRIPIRIGAVVKRKVGADDAVASGLMQDDSIGGSSAFGRLEVPTAFVALDGWRAAGVALPVLSARQPQREVNRIDLSWL
jgi:hypothetical protein